MSNIGIKEDAEWEASNEYMMVKKNALAIAQTLEHHGKVFDELRTEIGSLRKQVISMGQELVMQKNMIVKSLQQSYGHGPTS